jgi:crossover junction endodeoxyribonuclease RusA
MPTLTIPFPPSLNHYWRQFRGRAILSKAGRQYRVEAQTAAEAFRVLSGLQHTITGRIAVHLAVYPPDRRRRDLDNMPKAILDALTHAGVYADDSQIDDLQVVRMPTEKPGRVEVTITEIDAA